jgi:opacity protein-like surface antigen
MIRPGTFAMAAVVVLLAAAPARADLTAFVGANTTPNNRRAVGAAVGAGLLIVGFEFEYSSTAESDDPMARAPSLKTGMANMLLQTPGAIHGFQPYYTVGAGIFRETLGSQSDTSGGLNTGGGVKISLAGPLRLRVDYRLFKLGSGAQFSPAHRIYAGLNLKF